MTPEANQRLVRRLGYEFTDPGLLSRALTHRSWCAEHAGVHSNERLEFLGDAVLGLVVADHAFRTNPTLGEGWLSRARSTVVRSTALAEMAAEIDLGSAILLGKGEDASGGRSKPSILADTLEAVIGAVFLDGGWEVVQHVVLRLLGDRLDEVPAVELDHKSHLQELLARLGRGAPRYLVSEHGPDHDKQFRAQVCVDEVAYGTGAGHTKKAAEQAAAAIACAALLDHSDAADQRAAQRSPTTPEGNHG